MVLWMCYPPNFSSVGLATYHHAERRDFVVESLIDRNRGTDELCYDTCCSPPSPSWWNMMLSISRRERFCTVNPPWLAPAKGCRSCPSSPAGVFSGRDAPWPRFAASASPCCPAGECCTNPHRAGPRPAFVVTEEGGDSVTCNGRTPVLKASREGGGLGTLRQPLRGW